MHLQVDTLSVLSSLDYFTQVVDLSTFLSVSPLINGNSSDTSLASPAPQAFEGSGTGVVTGACPWLAQER
jgi:hypothetical protein